MLKGSDRQTAVAVLWFYVHPHRHMLLIMYKELGNKIWLEIMSFIILWPDGSMSVL